MQSRFVECVKLKQIQNQLSELEKRILSSLNDDFALDKQAKQDDSLGSKDQTKIDINSARDEEINQNNNGNNNVNENNNANANKAQTKSVFDGTAVVLDKQSAIYSGKNSEKDIESVQHKMDANIEDDIFSADNLNDASQSL